MKTILTILLGLTIFITPILSQNETEIRTDGLLIPRVDRNTVNNPTAGHLVYDFVSDQFWYYTGTEWKSVNTDDQTLKDILDISGDAGNNRILNLLDPINAQDAATKNYVDLNDENTDEQDLFITGNTLELSGDPNSGVDLSGYLDNTDSQDLSLTGNTLMITGDPNTDVDLSGYLDNTDEQDLILTGNLLEITGDPNAGVDLSPYLDNTDSQNLSSVLSQGNDANSSKITNLSDPTSDQDAATKKYVDDLDAAETAARIANDDNLQMQINADTDGDATNEIQDLSISGNILTITLNGSATQIDLSPYLDDTDNQDLSISGNTLSISNDPNTDVDLSTYLDNTDNQDLSLSGNTLSLTNDGTSVDLSGYLDNTDDQGLSDVLGMSNNASNLKITNLADPTSAQDAATKNYVDSNDDVDDADASTTNELQTISKSGSTVTLSNGGGSFTDEVNDADNDPTNELDNTDEQDLSLSGNTLSISNDPNTDVDLSPYLDNTDDQNISGSSFSGNMLTIGIENGSSQTIDLSSLDDDTDDDSDPTNEIQTLASILATSTDAGNNKITNIADPTSNQDVASKSYVDNNSGGGTTQGSGSNSYNIKATNEGTTSGSTRGENSVDLQTERNLSSQVASGDHSLILGGARNSSSGPYSLIVGGRQNSVTGPYGSVLGGFDNSVGNDYATIGGGLYNSANSYGSTITGGESNITNGDYSVAIGGKGIETKTYNEIVIGSYNETISGDQSSFVPTDPLLIIGNGSTSGTRSNAMVIRKDGNVGIGTNTPDSKLHLEGNIKVVDGNQADGKVLTSDANGVGTWEAPQSLTEILTSDNDAGNNKITNVMDPMNDQDVATKAYVDSLLLPLQLLHGLKIQDIDGNAYDVIDIGSQTWLGQNLKVTRYNDGTPLLEVTDNTEWTNLTTPGYCWYENDSQIYGEIYGALYNWYAVADTNSLNICPTGWHIPSHNEWNTLRDYLDPNASGNTNDAAGKMKHVGTTFWNAPNIATNESRFTALPGGYRNYNSGTFTNLGFNAFWWSSTTGSHISRAYTRECNGPQENLVQNTNPKEFGFSVRCIKD